MEYDTYDRAAVGAFATHEEAESAMELLERAGVSLKAISIVGRGAEIHDAELGRYVLPEPVAQGVEHEGARVGIWTGGAFGLLLGCASFLVPGLGMLVVLGPLAGMASGMVMGAVGGDVLGECSVTDIAARYRNWLADGKYLVIIHCSAEEEPRVLEVLQSLHSSEVHGLSIKVPVGV